MASLYPLDKKRGFGEYVITDTQLGLHPKTAGVMGYRDAGLPSNGGGPTKFNTCFTLSFLFQKVSPKLRKHFPHNKIYRRSTYRSGLECSVVLVGTFTVG